MYKIIFFYDYCSANVILRHVIIAFIVLDQKHG